MKTMIGILCGVLVVAVVAIVLQQRKNNALLHENDELRVFSEAMRDEANKYYDLYRNLELAVDGAAIPKSEG